MSAAEAPAPSGRGEPDGLARLIDSLELAPATREAARALLLEAASRKEALERERAGAANALHARLSAESPDEEELVGMARALGQLETELRVHRITTLLRLRALLSAEERALLAARMGQGGARIRRACAPDQARHCAQVEGHHALRRCLHAHRHELEPGCRDALGDAPLR
ncbi:MAG: hypothetical protein OEY14_12655 [Myxococcales bacterium]|nr:hypothetical protein [Myxococcales bacterium]